ncbi:MAG: alpha/beta fold hydrolase [Bacteroidetes bacterium]|nr:MAG: alpha/beta fold hydrolase [Bacteroidota bacterium]
MPLTDSPGYVAPRWLRNPHFNSIYAAVFRKVPGVFYERERLLTPDDDFLDLDWSRTGSRRLLIACHGLEGSADRPYMRGMIRHFNRHGWDGLGINFRGCGGELNRKPYSYHMGWTTDLDFMVQKMATQGNYDEIALIGFSLGGNVVLNYLGRKGREVPQIVRKAVAFSVPCHIESANVEINRRRNRLYLWRFMRSLNEKARIKAAQFPGAFAFDPKNPPTSFYEFDEQVTAPAHGFASNRDYWEKTSSLPVLDQICIPTLLVNAADDTFLSAQCYPVELARKHPFFHFEKPRHGGHVGFVEFNNDGSFWSEKRALAFVQNNE